MNRREQLQEAYEDALFALLMEDVIEAEGNRLLEENERLKCDPSAAVPEEVNERCLKTIHRAYGQHRRTETGKQVGRSFTKIFSRAAVVVVICMLLFTVAYAVSPELRVATLNLLIDVSDVNTILSVQNDDKPQTSYDTSEAAQAVYEQFGYRIPEMPEGFALTEELVLNTASTLKYVNPDNASIIFTLTRTFGGGYGVDTEDAQRVEKISVNGADGLLIAKDNWIRITWTNTDQNIFVSIIATGVNENLLWSIIDTMTSDTN